ncbi:(2Fe-2S) ferredoxin domain-containing protein [Frigoriflavimonas asaccharolytica]|uniref:NADH:ubiquinone oxidoreductase subunit E n=1 Tax=Frigoriflavimonas asaccharolytica TaxID=2735899 RepID=A0A8J8KA43_9FLAO|nr:(2Fe-2S) ferredoxin domain-containing protein [Frigoriflavimonas asaccharolytica]NRS93782.1 NADH:ubiquinone oxidoreductase subunit E [Frigoriflavimonas asaccharolytica]
MEESNNGKPIIFWCNGANCRKKKGKLLDFYVKKYNLKNKIEIEKMDCNNRCQQAPVLHLHPEDIWFSEKDLGTIIKRNILNK